MTLTEIADCLSQLGMRLTDLERAVARLEQAGKEERAGKEAHYKDVEP